MPCDRTIILLLLLIILIIIFIILIAFTVIIIIINIIIDIVDIAFIFIKMITVCYYWYMLIHYPLGDVALNLSVYYLGLRYRSPRYYL